MWTHRKSLPLKTIKQHAYANFPPLMSLPSVGGPSKDAIIGEEGDLTCITSISYTVIAGLSEEDARSMSWIWAGTCENPTEAPYTLRDGTLNQIEYFFLGTNNGELLLYPLLPPGVLVRRDGGDMPSTFKGTERAPPFARLLHQHTPTEVVMSVAVVGSLVASACMDKTLMISMYHPTPCPVAKIAHPSPLRCVLLWEGKTAQESDDTVASVNRVNREDGVSAAASNKEVSPRWTCASPADEEDEAAAVYAFTGDEQGTVRLWRVNVLTREFFLHSVFVMSNLSGWTSSASGLLYEAGEADLASVSRDNAKVQIRTGEAIHSMARDGDDRIIVGTEGRLVVWSLKNVELKVREIDHVILGGASAAETTPEEEEGKLKVRAARMLNSHVWVKSGLLLQSELEEQERAMEALSNEERQGVVAPPSKFKPKYERCITDGKEVGDVSNRVERITKTVCVETLAAEEEPMRRSRTALLQQWSVPLTFPSLSKTVRYPLTAVEPVQHPYSSSLTNDSAIFAVQVLQPRKRIVTSGSDGSVRVWKWEEDEDVKRAASRVGSYVQLFATSPKDDGGLRGLGKHLCILRSPDIFVSCGYDDGCVREWHVYDEPEPLMKCERRFALLQANSKSYAAKRIADRAAKGISGIDTVENGGGEVEDEVIGIGCAAAFPLFGALFLVGAFEATVQTFSLSEVYGCAAPPTHLYNGYKTVRITDELIQKEKDMLGTKVIENANEEVHAIRAPES